MLNNTCVIIQCRYDSKRLPGKILKELEKGIKSIDHLAWRVSEVDFPVIIATTNEDSDLPIVHHYKQIYKKYGDKFSIYCGDKLNIAKRLFNASEGYENIIRITGDDIFVDVDWMIKLCSTQTKRI